MTAIIIPPQTWQAMNDVERCFGNGMEVTSRELGAIGANIFRFVPVGPDVIHCHERGEETYWLTPGSYPIEMWLDGEIRRIEPETAVIIQRNTWHAARPTIGPEGLRGYAEFIVVSSPPFDPNHIDQFNWSERPVEWYGEDA